MGWYFQLEHVNIVAYLTSPQAKCPRITFPDLFGFLDGLHQGWQKAFISADESWPEKMGRKAEASLTRLKNRAPPGQEFVPAHQLEDYIGELRQELGKYSFYALAVFDRDGAHRNQQLLAFMNSGAYRSGAAGLFLISDQCRSFDYNFLDPFPPLQILAKNPGRTPGVVFWTDSAVAFVPIRDADRILNQVMEAGGSGEAGISLVLRDYELGMPDKRLLHLSDLHFGKPRATALQQYLVSSIAREAKRVDRIVITGDLFDTPNPTAMDAFLNFRYQLEGLTNKDLVIVPGNHDQSFRGNRLGRLGKDLQEVAALDWKSLEVDDEMRCVFFGFDSSLEASFFARGAIRQEQLIRIGTQYQTRVDRNPDLAHYLSVALIHHHPFSWRSEEPNILGVDLEDFLALDEPDPFLGWCARRKVSLILHGHKHQPRQVAAYQDGHWLTSIGCGSSLGAENGPLSYNLLAWHPNERKWGATFMIDPGDTSGFAAKFVSVSNASGH